MRSASTSSSRELCKTEYQDAVCSGQMSSALVHGELEGPIVLGIREVSRPLQFESSYTVLQHAPEDSIENEIVPQAVGMIDALKQAWRDRQSPRGGRTDRTGDSRQPRFGRRRVPASRGGNTPGGWFGRDHTPSLHPYPTQPVDGAMGLQADDRRRHRTARVRAGGRWLPRPAAWQGSLTCRLDAAHGSHHNRIRHRLAYASATRYA